MGEMGERPATDGELDRMRKRPHHYRHDMTIALILRVDLERERVVALEAENERLKARIQELEAAAEVDRRNAREVT